MLAGVGRAGDFAGNPLATVDTEALTWLDPAETSIRGFFTGKPGLPAYKWITYNDGTPEGYDVSSPQDFAVATPGVVPDLAAIAVPVAVYDGAYDPLGSQSLANLVTLLEAIRRKARGRHRVANDAAEGYAVYVGYGEMPDFTAPPAAFGAALPVDFAITPPLSGTVELFVVTRKVNKYGLESQNTYAQRIVIDENGDEVLGTLQAPTILGVISVEDEYFKVFAEYQGVDTDTTPADEWRLYIGEGVAPVPGVDVPVDTGTVGDGARETLRAGPYVNGGVTYYFAVTVYRTEDGTESAAATFELTLPADPEPPPPVLGAALIE